MNIEAKKMSLIERLIGIRKESTLSRFEDLLKQAELIEENEVMSIEDYNNRIDEAEERVASGQFTTQEDLEKEIKEW